MSRPMRFLASEPVVNNQVLKTFPPEPNGDVVQLATGAFVARLTNTSTGKSITVNTSGPGRFTVHSDDSATLEAWGRWFFALIENAPVTVFISSGRAVLSIAPDGTVTLLSHSGRVEDVCALLS
jgi:sarcosine oxidase gamma subunit